MGDAPMPHPQPPHTPSPSPTPPSIVPMLYYSLIIIATVAGLLAVYNLIIIKCGNNYSSSTAADRASGAFSGSGSISSFAYTAKDGGSNIDNNECSVCLSVFEEGEQLKLLPNCGHCFHALCIDKWLYSHANCPLCRRSATEFMPEAESREVLIGSVVLV